jgi:hypothetical protein
MSFRLDGWLALVLVAALAACGPILLLPGGELEGKMVPAPSDWAFTDDVSTVQLETRPDDPYSVNIWAVGLGPGLWVENMEADPHVRLQVEDAIYELRSSRVERQDEFDRFSDAYEKKYGRRPRNESVEEAYLFRLAAP